MVFSATVPFVEEMGVKLIRFEDGESTIEYTPRPEHLNSFGVLHGGAVMTLLDVALAQAARSLQPDLGMLTIEMKTSFMRGAPGQGGTLQARGRVLHRTSKMAFAEGTLFDAQGQACAHATGTFKYAARRSPDGVIATD